MNLTDISKKYPVLKKVLASVLTVDIGNTFTKTSTNVIFASRVSSVSKHGSRATGISNVTWNGKFYTVGNKDGKLNMESNKYMSDHYKLNLLNAIALSFKGETKIKVRLAVGLPAEYYIDHSIPLKNEIKKMERQSITINNITYDIEILDVQVFKQGGTLSAETMEMFSYPMLLLDFGGGTLDVSQWKYEKDEFGNKVLGMTKASSFAQHGFEPTIEALLTKFNSAEGSDGNYDISDAIEYLEEDELPFGETNVLQDIKDLVLRPYAEKAISSINSSFKPNTCKDIRIIGGPADLLLEYLKTEFKKTEPKLIDNKDPQCANAILFSERYKELLVLEYLDGNKEVAVTKEAGQ